MAETKRTLKVYETEHSRLKQLAAEAEMSMIEYLAAIIDEQWDGYLDRRRSERDDA